MSIIQMFFLVGAILAGSLVAFQLLLAAGLPFGKMAWGGENAKLSKKLRISSFISSLILVYASVVLLEKAGLVNIIDNNTAINISAWIYVFVFGLSTMGNITSKSKYEKIVMTPVAIYLVVAFLIAIVG